MKDKEWGEQKERVERIAAKWVDRLGLKWWGVKIHYFDVPLPEIGVMRNPGDVCVMQCQTHWQYLDADISVDLSQLVDRSDAEVEEFFLHECMHILLNEARQMDREDWLMHEERLCSMLARTYMWTEQCVRKDCAKEEKK